MDSVNSIFLNIELMERHQRAFFVFIYSYLNTKQTFDAFEGLHNLAFERKEKFFSIHFPFLFSVTNLSKIWNETRVYELSSPGMEDITLQ